VKNYSRAILALALILYFFITKIFAQSNHVVINEFLASNQNVIQDPEFDKFSDWIELYNSTDKEVNLTGYFLTDNIDIPDKWEFPDNTTIPANGYLIVWADGEDSDLHSNFKISKSGEEFTLQSGYCGN